MINVTKLEEAYNLAFYRATDDFVEIAPDWAAGGAATPDIAYEDWKWYTVQLYIGLPNEYVRPFKFKKMYPGS